MFESFTAGMIVSFIAAIILFLAVTPFAQFSNDGKYEEVSFFSLGVIGTIAVAIGIWLGWSAVQPHILMGATIWLGGILITMILKVTEIIVRSRKFIFKTKDTIQSNLYHAFSDILQTNDTIKNKAEQLWSTLALIATDTIYFRWEHDPLYEGGNGQFVIDHFESILSENPDITAGELLKTGVVTEAIFRGVAAKSRHQSGISFWQFMFIEMERTEEVLVRQPGTNKPVMIRHEPTIHINRSNLTTGLMGWIFVWPSVLIELLFGRLIFGTVRLIGRLVGSIMKWAMKSALVP